MSNELKICVKCNLLLPLIKFEKQRFKLANGEENFSYRKKCKHCRIGENKDRLGKNDGYRKYYWGMSEEKRAEYIKKKSAQNSKRKNISEKRKQYNKSDKGIFLSYIHESYRRSRLERGIKMELDFDSFSKLINDPCDYCGKINCRGIDRVDSSKSYTIENSVPCCKICNQMKNNMSLEEFMEHIGNILKYRAEFV